ncbi:MAG TPA: KOW domain-containing RNA-binding protein [Candidatus Anaerotignum merdipullorum]|nr:KOW domain-containing RNA-binding protein [Candidatus Anaerotignum merdipullorum]
MEYQSGQVVYSKSGHDKGDVLIVLSVEGNYVYLADGKRRRLEKPKRKKKIHVQPTGYVDTALADKLAKHAYILNADIAKAIQRYKEVGGNII